MAKIYKYQKVIDKFTTHLIAEPDYNLLETEDRITELCTIGADTYVSVPDSITLPPQSKQIKVEEVKPTDELRAEICASSPHTVLISNRVVLRIREKYSIDDELKMLRMRESKEFILYNEYVEECRAWGNAAKARLGLS